MGTLKQICAALAAVFTWATGRSAARNTPAMQAAAAAKSDAAQADTAATTVAAATQSDAGLEQLRKEASE